MFLIGAGGHAKVVRDILDACSIPFSGVVTDNLKEVAFMEKKILHSMDEVDEAIICVGNNRTRKKLAEEMSLDVSHIYRLKKKALNQLKEWFLHGSATHETAKGIIG